MGKTANKWEGTNICIYNKIQVITTSVVITKKPLSV